MKQEISKGAMIGIIAAVVVVVGFIGYRVFLGGKGKAYAADYYQKQGASGSGGTGSGGMVPPVGGMGRPGSMGMGSSGGMVPPGSAGMSRPYGSQ